MGFLILIINVFVLYIFVIKCSSTAFICFMESESDDKETSMVVRQGHQLDVSISKSDLWAH